MYNINKKSNKLDGDVAWFGANYVYEDIYMIQDKIRECIIVYDVNNAIAMLDELLIVVMPYLKKFMTNEDKKLLENNTDLYFMQKGYKSENTDIEKECNMSLSKDIIRSINNKRMRISHLMAEANLGINLKDKPRDLPAAFALDDN